MSIVATTLGALLTTQADYNYYIQQQIHWTNLYDANSAKLEEQVKAEEKWEKARDDAFDNEKKDDFEYKVKGGRTYNAKALRGNDALCEAYAHDKVSEYNEELMLELENLDIEYDTMKTMYDTLVQELSALKDSEKQLVSTNAQDTGLLNQ